MYNTIKNVRNSCERLIDNQDIPALDNHLRRLMKYLPDGFFDLGTASTSLMDVIIYRDNI